jgi:uncharacterized protein YegP (UPF0339 family)
MKGKLKWELYRNAIGDWQWRVKSGNGRIIAASSEGFETRAGAVRNLRLIDAKASDLLKHGDSVSV